MQRILLIGSLRTSPNPPDLPGKMNTTVRREEHTFAVEVPIAKCLNCQRTTDQEVSHWRMMDRHDPEYEEGKIQVVPGSWHAPDGWTLIHVDAPDEQRRKTFFLCDKEECRGLAEWPGEVLEFARAS